MAVCRWRGDVGMDAQNIVGLIAAVGIVFYLLWALTHPEQF